ncbi:MAG TPA: ROK family protein, partial [Gaiellaceae bacterium]|nr:ROK family protein [Gaiellaceae bacterium]
SMAAQRTIGIDVGGTKILAGVVERDGSVLRSERRETPTESTEAFLAGLAEVVDTLRDESVVAVGIGIPSTIDQRTGSSVFSVHVPLEGVPLRERGEHYLGLPVAVDNDANAAAVAEWTVGAGRGTQHMVMLTLGTGIGGGLILGGRLYRGATGAAAELGHIVIEFDGPECRGACTGRGHFERFASGSAADDLARELLGPEADSKQLVAAARDGDERAVRAFVDIGRRLGAGLASLVNAFDPEVVVIGGGFGEALDLMLDPALETMRRDALPPGRDNVRIVPAELGEDAGMVGAGLIAFEALDED